MNKPGVRVSMNEDFRNVMLMCGKVSRKGQDGTWIQPEMVDAYETLHHQGHAHSVEVYDDSGLIGGLYGIGLGKIFSGESMFALKPNASKIAFVHLCRFLETQGYEWIDCQQDTPHLRSLGATLIEEDEYLEKLRLNQPFI